MVQEIFKTVWELALQGTLMMLCVLMVRPLLKRMPRNLTCLLWALLAVRLIVPWNIPVAVPGGWMPEILRTAAWNEISGRFGNGELSGEQQSVGNGILEAAAQQDGRVTFHAAMTETAAEAALQNGGTASEKTAEAGIENGGVAPEMAAPGENTQPDSGFKSAVPVAGLADIFRQRAAEWSTLVGRIAPVIWAAGAAAVCMYWIVIDVRLKRRVREAVLVKKLCRKIRVMECDRIDTAFVLGVFRPTIYLPDSLKNPDRKYVLLHEKTHLRRKDHIWKWAACLLLGIYWFHPLMWICVSAFFGDMEEACDEAVLKKLGAGGKLPYARAIFHEADTKSLHWAAAPGFGEGNMKKRVKHVLDYQKKAAAGVLLTVIVILGACSPFFLENQAVESEMETDAAEFAALNGKQESGSPEIPGESGTEDPEVSAEAQSGRDEHGYRADYVAQNAWTVLAVEAEELTDPLMALDPYCALLRKNEGSAENVRLSYAEPVPDAEISDTYGVRQHPSTQEQVLHSGVDFAAQKGSPVLAAAPGVVVETGSDAECGNYVILRHANGDLTYYANCGEILAEQTESVNTGDQIATVGNTGMSTGPHLHFALSREGVYLDPFAEPGGFLKITSPVSYRDSLTEAELEEIEKIALNYCNQMNWGSVLSIEAVPDDDRLYENEGIESEYEAGNIIIYAVSTKEDEAAGNPKRKISVARKSEKLSWQVINEGF